MEIDEKKIVYSIELWDIIMHDDGHVDISAGDDMLLQIPKEQFDEMIARRRAHMLGN